MITEKQIDGFLSKNSTSALPVANKYFKEFLMALMVGGFVDGEFEEANLLTLEKEIDGIFNQFQEYQNVDFISFFYDKRLINLKLNHLRDLIFLTIRDNSFEILKTFCKQFYKKFTLYYSDISGNKSTNIDLVFFTDTNKFTDESLVIDNLTPPLSLFLEVGYSFEDVQNYYENLNIFQILISCIKPARLMFFQEFIITLNLRNLDNQYCELLVDNLAGDGKSSLTIDVDTSTDENPETFTDYDYRLYIQGMNSVKFIFKDGEEIISKDFSFNMFNINNSIRYSWLIEWADTLGDKNIDRLILFNSATEQVLFDLKMKANNYLPSYNKKGKSFILVYFDV